MKIKKQFHKFQALEKIKISCSNSLRCENHMGNSCPTGVMYSIRGEKEIRRMQNSASLFLFYFVSTYLFIYF